MSEIWDAIVIGGGPAGSGVATHLARAGRRVLVVERARFPRAHVGESLLPGVIPYLEALGARELVASAGFEIKDGQSFYFGRDREPWRIDFGELDLHPYAWFVDRARFDELLLRHAARSGAEVLEERSVTRVIFEAGRAVGVTYREPSGEEREARSRFVVDASGQSALVARRAGLRRYVRGLKNAAFWAHFKGVRRLDPPARQHILTASIPAGWVWVIPLGETTSVGVVTSRATRDARDGRGVEAWFDDAIRSVPEVLALLEQATRETPVSTARDWSYRSRRTSGPGVLLAGDAACFIDPILSTGVHVAMSSAYWAAAAIESSLATPALEPFFRRFYDETIGVTYRELLRQVKAFYRAEGNFESVYWTSKRILRTGGLVEGERAFLFITAGLLRNAATAAPHDPFAQLEAESGGGAPIAAPAIGGKVVSPRLVFRSKRGAELVTVRADGLRLSLVRHQPRGLRDRPPRSFAVLEIAGAEREPLGALLVTLDDKGAFEASILAYPERGDAARALGPVLASARGLLAGLPDAPLAKRLGRARALLRRDLPRRLAPGVAVVPRSAHRGGGVAEPPLTAVFEALEEPGLGRIYFVAEARVPLELADIPMLRTRFLDVVYRPARTRDGRRLDDIPSVARVIAEARASLAGALAGVPSLPRAFDVADATLGSIRLTGFRLVACGRLGDGRHGRTRG